jgi:hypothetical protein
MEFLTIVKDIHFVDHQVTMLKEVVADYNWVETCKTGFLFQVGKWMEYGTRRSSLMAESIFLDREEYRVADRWVC